MLKGPIGLPNPDVPPNAELSDLDLAILEEIWKLDARLDKIQKLDPALLDKIRKFDPDVHDELYNNQVSKDKMKEREGLAAEKPGQTECKDYSRSRGRKHEKACSLNPGRGEPSVAPILECNFLGLPIRPGKKDCSFYMRNASCMFGTNCRFNHPDPTAARESDPPSGYGNGGSASLQGALSSTAAPWSAPRSLNDAPLYVPMVIPPSQGIPSQDTEWNGYQAPAYLQERSMPAHQPYLMNNSVTGTNVYKQYPHQQAEEFPERPGQPVCSYFLRTGDCKFKSNCKFHHPKTWTAVSPSCTL